MSSTYEILTIGETIPTDIPFPDILIVDNNKDLNVYNAEVADTEAEGKSCCGTSIPKEKAPAKSCRGTSVPKEKAPAKSCCGTSVSGMEPASGACSDSSAPVSEPATKSCCGTKAPKEESMDGPATVGVDLGQVDFNRYAGSFNVYAVKA